MREPLYHVGQKVAACSRHLQFVIPATVVKDITYIDSTAPDGETGCGRRFTGWVYWIPEYEDMFFEECELRPYFDDDYKTESEEQERSNARTNNA